MVGAASEPRTAATAVSGARIQLFAAMVHDGNRSYWDAEYARQTMGRPAGPAGPVDGMADTSAVAAGGRPPAASVVLRVPLPGTTFINAANDVEFLQPIVEGDLLTVVEELVSVSPEKRTRLGVGHFVQTLETYRRQDGTVVASEPKHLVPLHPATALVTGEDLDWNEIDVPVELPEVVDEISYQRVVENAGATWDYFPGHFDPGYAQSQGNPTIYVNTMHLAGFADRVATDWAGPGSRVVRRSMRLAGSIYAGDTMVGRGRAVAKRCDTSVDPPRYLVDIQIEVTNQHGALCCPVELTLQLPG